MSGIGFSITLIIAMAISFAALIGAALLARRQQRRLRFGGKGDDVAEAVKALAAELRRSNDLLEAMFADHDRRLEVLESATTETGGPAVEKAPPSER